MIIAMAGLPGTGKSTLARVLSAELSAVLLDKDVVRAALFPPEEIEYSTQQDDFVVEVLLQVANFYVQKNASRPILLDGRPFSKEQQVMTLVNYAQTHAWDLRVISCTCSDETARSRLEHDAAAGEHLATNRDYSLYLRLKAQSDPLIVPHLNVDTGEPLELCITRCLEYLGGRPDQLNQMEEIK